MAVFGRYEILDELYPSAAGSIFLAALPGESKSRYVVKTFAPPIGVFGKASADRQIENFLARVRSQKVLGELPNSAWAPILDSGHADGQAYLVMPFYPRTVQTLLDGHVRLTAPALNRIVLAVVLGLSQIRKHADRPCGNLKATNILIDDRGLSVAGVFLTDALSSDRANVAGDRTDLEVLGHLIHSLVVGSVTAATEDLTGSTAESWSRLGAASQGWRELTRRLVNGADESLTVETLPAELSRISHRHHRSRSIAMAASLLLLVLIAVCTLWLRPAKKGGDASTHQFDASFAKYLADYKNLHFPIERSGLESLSVLRPEVWAAYGNVPAPESIRSAGKMDDVIGAVNSLEDFKRVAAVPWPLDESLKAQEKVVKGAGYGLTAMVLKGFRDKLEKHNPLITNTPVADDTIAAVQRALNDASVADKNATQLLPLLTVLRDDGIEQVDERISENLAGWLVQPDFPTWTHELREIALDVRQQGLIDPGWRGDFISGFSTSWKTGSTDPQALLANTRSMYNETPLHSADPRTELFSDAEKLRIVAGKVADAQLKERLLNDITVVGMKMDGDKAAHWDLANRAVIERAASARKDELDGIRQRMQPTLQAGVPVNTLNWPPGFENTPLGNALQTAVSTYVAERPTASDAEYIRNKANQFLQDCSSLATDLRNGSTRVVADLGSVKTSLFISNAEDDSSAVATELDKRFQFKSLCQIVAAEKLPGLEKAAAISSLLQAGREIIPEVELVAWRELSVPAESWPQSKQNREIEQNCERELKKRFTDADHQAEIDSESVRRAASYAKHLDGADASRYAKELPEVCRWMISLNISHEKMDAILPSTTVFNLYLARMREDVSKTNDEKAVQALVDAFVLQFDGKFSVELAGLKAASKSMKNSVQKMPFDGWQQSSRGRTVTYKRGQSQVSFIKLNSCYMMSGEVGVSLFNQIMSDAPDGGWHSREPVFSAPRDPGYLITWQADPDRGPIRSIKARSMWIGPSKTMLKGDYFSWPKMEGISVDNFVALLGSVPQDPPMEYVSYDEAKYCAGLVSCRLPAGDEWNQACEFDNRDPTGADAKKPLVRDGDKLRDSAWLARVTQFNKALSLTDTIASSPDDPLSDAAKHALGDLSIYNLLRDSYSFHSAAESETAAKQAAIPGEEMRAVYPGLNSGGSGKSYPFFRTVGNDPERFLDLVGNVAQWVDDGSGTDAVIGGSALSPDDPTGWPINKPKRLPKSRYGFCDVGFRLVYNMDSQTPLQVMQSAVGKMRYLNSDQSAR